tara:strand:+ start:374 stop:3058 length:2685 start_codon:yes stop_codon:yes gene_type:complete
MTNIRRALQAAAAGGDDAVTYVEDVFSTHVYTGNGAIQGIENDIKLGDFGVGTSTEFNGTSDYLSRTSDLAGNADGKTFTLSFWVYSAPQYGTIYSCSPGSASWKFKLERGSSSPGARIDINANNSSGSTILQLAIRDGSDVSPLPDNAWANYLISVDLANASNRGVYVNDVDYSSISDWDIYTDDSIAFENSHHAVAAFTRAAVDEWFKGRLAHVFLDYTYRDLSVTSNRRDFIDANGGSTSPATLSALNPIIYLPMTTGYSIGENLGTGGDFTSNGPPSIVNSGTEYEAGAGKGGLVWMKNRGTAGRSHALYDTERGVEEELSTNTDTAEAAENQGLTAFNYEGFVIGNRSLVNTDTDTYGSWTFRKAPGFFDIVTYTGNGVNRTLNHNLKCVPAFIIVKRYSSAEDWTCYQDGLGATKYIQLNGTGAADTETTIWNDTAPTSSVFTVGTHARVNTDLETYVAYVFAGTGDAASEIFGADGDQSIIKCGSFTTTTTWGNYKIDLGWEPQYFLMKRASAAGDWFLLDNVRGIVGPGDGTLVDTSAFNGVWGVSDDAELQPNDNSAETEQGRACLYSQGVIGAFGYGNTDVLYMAIRRPMKVPTAGTEVFTMDTLDGTPLPSYKSDFVVDMAFTRATTGNSTPLGSRLAGKAYLVTDTTAAQSDNGNWTWDYNNGWMKDTGGPTLNNYGWMFKRAPTFFDVVCWADPAGTQNSVAHGLGVVPELVIVRYRDAIDSWYVYTSATGYMLLDTAGGIVGTTDYMASTTASVLNVTGLVGNPANEPIAYLFATVEGVSKVGTYTADTTVTTIDCGFSAGARFILIKKRGAGNWYYWDYSRGIVAGDDPYLILNDNDAEVTDTDWIDPDNSGFTITDEAGSVSGGINIDTEDYIFLAIA